MLIRCWREAGVSSCQPGIRATRRLSGVSQEERLWFCSQQKGKDMFPGAVFEASLILSLPDPLLGVTLPDSRSVSAAVVGSEVLVYPSLAAAFESWQCLLLQLPLLQQPCLHRSLWPGAPPTPASRQTVPFLNNSGARGQLLFSRGVDTNNGVTVKRTHYFSKKSALYVPLIIFFTCNMHQPFLSKQRRISNRETMKMKLL